MSKIIIIVISFLLIAESLFSQSGITIKAIDVESKIGIPYATVQYFVDDNKKVTYCDSMGYCRIENLQTIDSIVVSCIGYLGKSISSLNNTTTKSIELESVRYKIKELNLLPRKDEELGGTKMRGYGRTHSAPNTIRTSYIPNEGFNDALIDNVAVQLYRDEHYSDSCEDHIRIHIFSVTDEFIPGIDLLDHDSIIYIDSSTELPLTIDVSQFRLKFPKSGVFIGYEYLGTFNKKTRKLAYSNCEDIMTLNALTNEKNKISYVAGTYNTEWIRIRSGNKNKYFLFGISIKYK